MPTLLVFPSPAAAAAVVCAAYLIGSVPFGYIVARAKGVDIRRIGSGNIGATNVARACGRLAGKLVLALDIAKGFVPAAFIAPLMLAWLDPAAEAQALAASRAAAALAALAAIVGHNWPVWLLFRGGKGVAVTIGAFAAPALLGYWMLAPLAVWGLAAHVSGYVSVGSMSLGAATAAAAIALWATGRADASAAAAGVLAALLIVLRHRANIARLSAGTEPRRGAETPPPSGGPTAPGREGGER